MTEIGLAEYFGIIANSRLAINKIFLIIFIYLLTPQAGRLPRLHPTQQQNPSKNPLKSHSSFISTLKTIILVINNFKQT